MDMGVIAILKALYKRITFEKAHEKHNTLAEFLKDYKIIDAVKNLGAAWSEVTQKTMRGVWKKLLQGDEPNEPPTDQIIEEVVNLGSDLDLELNTQNVKQCLEFDERHMSSEDLFEINQPRAFEHEELEDIPENPAEMS